jgi:hypothetical protein|tara:strand:+ start:108 stop:269 length:162 start_codon:yes stop_codon:yes gene_type:complete
LCVVWIAAAPTKTTKTEETNVVGIDLNVATKSIGRSNKREKDNNKIIFYLPAE